MAPSDTTSVAAQQMHTVPPAAHGTTPLVSLVLEPTTCRASSVLDRNKTLYGAQHMLTSDVTTCWNSAQGSPQQILLQFHRQVLPQRLDFMFQGGFVGQDIELRVRNSATTNEWRLVADAIDPEDANDLQAFACETAHAVDALQIVFKRSTDFYGRVILYRLDVLGHEV